VTAFVLKNWHIFVMKTLWKLMETHTQW